VAPFPVAFQASPRRSHPCQFGLGRTLTITVAKAQHSSQPPMRRRALLASNPLRNRRLETHRNDKGATGTPPLSPTQHRCDRSPHASKNARPELHNSQLPTNSAEEPFFSPSPSARIRRQSFLQCDRFLSALRYPYLTSFFLYNIMAKMFVPASWHGRPRDQGFSGRDR
jgi:hypothetical protein